MKRIFEKGTAKQQQQQKQLNKIKNQKPSKLATKYKGNTIIKNN